MHRNRQVAGLLFYSDAPRGSAGQLMRRQQKPRRSRGLASSLMLRAILHGEGDGRVNWSGLATLGASLGDRLSLVLIHGSGQVEVVLAPKHRYAMMQRCAGCEPL